MACSGLPDGKPGAGSLGYRSRDGSRASTQSGASGAGVKSIVRHEGFLRKAVDFLFGYDFFISYSHRDGLDYPRELKGKLESAGFAVFVDQTGYVPGIDLRVETRRQVLKSTKIVVVGRPAALTSPWVKREIDIALSGGKVPILINIDRSVEQASPEAELAGMARVQHWLRLDEQLEAASSPPSDHAVAELIRAFGATRQEAKRQRAFALAAAVFALAASVAAWQAFEAYRQKRLAEQNEQRALVQRDRALLTQSRFLADLADQRIRDGDPGTALLLALEALPDFSGGTVRPLSPEAQQAASTAWQQLQEKRVLHGHEEAVLSERFSPDGKRIVTSSDDKSARIWDSDTGKAVAVLRGHTDSLAQAAFSPDGRRVVTASNDKTARIWNAETGEMILVLEGHDDAVVYAAFLPDGLRVITVSGRTLRLWDAASGKVIRDFEIRLLDGGAMSSDGRLFFSVSNLRPGIWDLESGQRILDLRKSGDMLAAAFSPDARRIVVTYADKTARILDARTGETVIILDGHRDQVVSGAFSPDGQRIVTASRDGTARLWNVATGKTIATLGGHSGAVLGAEISPDGRRVVTVSNDKTVRIWDSEPPIRVLEGHERLIWSARFSADGRYVATASWDKTTGLWDADTGRPITFLRGHSEGVRNAEFSPDQTRLVTASDDKTARIWSVESASTTTVLSGHALTVNSAAFNNDGTRALTASGDMTARVWDAATGGTIVTLSGHTGSVMRASFSPDGRRVITASDDKTARIWNVLTGQTLITLTGHTAIVWSAVFDAAGQRVATASPDGTARVWDAATGESIAVLHHRTEIFDAQFSPDGRLLATASSDGAVRIWEWSADRVIAVLKNPVPDERFTSSGTRYSGSVLSVQFSPDGRRVLSGSQDQKGRIWPLLPSTQDLIDDAKRVMPRCLGKEERGKFFLDADPPGWCIKMRKWPYSGVDPHAASFGTSLSHSVVVSSPCWCRKRSM
jgi:WD40 repeat protein